MSEEQDTETTKITVMFSLLSCFGIRIFKIEFPPYTQEDILVSETQYSLIFCNPFKEHMEVFLQNKPFFSILKIKHEEIEPQELD